MDIFEHEEPIDWLTLPNLRPRKAAAYLGISKSKLAKMRMKASKHEGPPFAKVAGVILYRKVDLDCWVASKLDGPSNGAAKIDERDREEK